METIERNTIFTNCARTDDGDVWWEGMTGEPPAHAIDWHGNDWTPDSDGPPPIRTPASPRPRRQCPSIAAGVGGPRRGADRRLPVRRSPREHRAAGHRGVRLGARRVPRRDDVASRRPRRRPARSASCASTRWRCCRSAATTWPTTSPTGCGSATEHDDAKLPRIFLVNWFRKDADGTFIWPGFGENSRVLEWVCRRCDGEGETVETPDRPRARRRRARHRRARHLGRRDGGAAARGRAPGPRAAAAGEGAPRALRRSAAGRAPGAARGAGAACRLPTEPKRSGRPLYERLAIPLVSSRPGSWFYVHVAPHLDRGLLRLTGGRVTTAGAAAWAS